jgi:hypothetical protein
MVPAVSLEYPNYPFNMEAFYFYALEVPTCVQPSHSSEKTVRQQLPVGTTAL